jgi:transketolase
MPNPRALSRLGPRGTFGLALLAIAEENDRVLGISADLAVTAGMDRFRQTIPDRFINVGIAEQNMIGIASGLAEDGWVPYAVSFANFSALRACEFARHHLGYMRQNVKLVGIGAGFAMGQFGTTHYSLEDVSALRAVPNLTIIAPADCTEVYEATCALASFPGPVYLRLNGVSSMPIVDQVGTRFEIGSARVLSSGSQITFVATGSMVARCLDATEILRSHGLDAGVINMHTIKPLDEATLRAHAHGRQLIVTVEEHSVIGGLGSSVAESLTQWGAQIKLLRLGVPDRFPKVGSYEFVLKECGLTAQNIADSALAELSASVGR